MEELQSCPTMGDDRSLEIADSLRALRDQTDQTLDSHRQHISQIGQQLHEQLEQIAEELANERLLRQQTLEAIDHRQDTLQQLEAALPEKELEVEQLLEKLAEQSLNFEQQGEERDDELRQLLELAEEENQLRETLEQDLQQTRKSLEQADATGSTERAATQNALSAAEQQLGDFRKQCDALQKQLQTLEAELDEARQSLQVAQQQNDEQLDQTRRKFELALADVQKFKRENSELHEELLSRPAADDQESPELISLRAERDALATRIDELETATTQAVTLDGQQELDDLQRRFELAVDDVRQLKQEKSDLCNQLKAAQTGVVVPAEEEAQDWQSQKARLLATLDAEDRDAITEARREERATIEGAISITDSIVAEKDQLVAEQERELQELRTQLAERSTVENIAELRQQITAEIFSNDETIQLEQARLQEQQQQLQAKLREAELEISVRRATLAREQAALKEKIAELPQADVAEDKQTDPAKKTGRRWLSALGINEEKEH